LNLDSDFGNGEEGKGSRDTDEGTREVKGVPQVLVLGDQMSDCWQQETDEGKKLE
jgi:hypothetical protein